MKKYIRLFLFAMAALFIMPNVHAREFTINDYNFTVEGIKINLYEVNYSKDENNQPIIAPEDLKKYALKQQTKVVNVDYTKLTNRISYLEQESNASPLEKQDKKQKEEFNYVLQ